MGDDIERLKIHKIKPRSTSDHVFLPVSEPHHPPTEPISEALGGTGEKLAKPIEPRLVKAAIIEALEKTRYNKTAAAKLLGLTFRQLRYRIKKLGIE